MVYQDPPRPGLDDRSWLRKFLEPWKQKLSVLTISLSVYVTLLNHSNLDQTSGYFPVLFRGIQTLRHLRIPQTDVQAEAWKSPLLAVFIPSEAPEQRQIQLEVVDELQLLPDTNYRVPGGLKFEPEIPENPEFYSSCWRHIMAKQTHLHSNSRTP